MKAEDIRFNYTSAFEILRRNVPAVKHDFIAAQTMYATYEIAAQLAELNEILRQQFKRTEEL